MRNVTTVVPVLMRSCQVSEKLKNGSLAAQTRTQSAKVVGRPAACATPLAMCAKVLDIRSERLCLWTITLTNAKTTHRPFRRFGKTPGDLDCIV